MKKFLLSINKSYFGAIDLLFGSALAWWARYAIPMYGWRYAGAVTLALFIVWALCHVIWLALMDPVDHPACEGKDYRMDFLADEGLSLIRVGNTWGVIDGDRKPVGSVHDAPHQAVDEAISLSVERELKEAGLTHD